MAIPSLRSNIRIVTGRSMISELRRFKISLPKEAKGWEKPFRSHEAKVRTRPHDFELLLPADAETIASVHGACDT